MCEIYREEHFLVGREMSHFAGEGSNHRWCTLDAVLLLPVVLSTATTTHRSPILRPGPCVATTQDVGDRRADLVHRHPKLDDQPFVRAITDDHPLPTISAHGEGHHEGAEGFVPLHFWKPGPHSSCVVVVCQVIREWEAANLRR